MAPPAVPPLIDPFDDLRCAVASAPLRAGAWAVGVSGGADSVALLRLLHAVRPDAGWHVVHLDHEWRGAASSADAEFVLRLAGQLGLGVTLARAGDLSTTGLPANAEARGRALRFALFDRVVREQLLCGVLLAHHQDDQAETVMLRLLRGGGYAAIRPMAADLRRASGLRVVRPLLGVRRERLREWLRSIGQDWREDTSNARLDFARNRVRAALASAPVDVVESLIEAGEACARVADWAAGAAPKLAEVFQAGALAGLPRVLARAAAGRWLVRHGCPYADCSTEVIDRLLAMAGDASTPPRVLFPGGLEVRRRGGIIAPGASLPGRGPGFR